MKKHFTFHKFLEVCIGFLSGLSFFGFIADLFFAKYPNLDVAFTCVDVFYKCSILWFCLCCLIIIVDAVISKYRTDHLAFSYKLKVWALSASLLGMFGWRLIHFIMCF